MLPPSSHLADELHLPVGRHPLPGISPAPAPGGLRMRVGHDGGDAEPPGQVRRGHRAPGPNLVELNIALPGEECGNIIVGVLLNHSGFLK